MANILKRLTLGRVLKKAEVDANFDNLNKDLIQLTPAIYAPRAPYGTVIIEPPVSGITVAPGAGVTVNSSGPSVVGGETLWVVNATGTSATGNSFEIQLPLAAEAFSAKDVAFEIWTPDMSKMQKMAMYVGTAAYAKFASHEISSAVLPTGLGPFCINGLTGYWVHEALWTKSGFSHPVGDLDCVQSKLRVYVPNGSTLTFGLRSVRAGVMRKKARLAIVADDGYKSWMRMGVPILQEYGLKSTMGIIYVALGVATDTVGLADLQAYVAAGNECVAHGPNHPVTGGAGNLFSVWGTNADRLADVLACRDFLVANSLTSQYGAKCYLWPQGKYTDSVTDLSFLNLMLDNGFTVGRTADGANANYHMQKNNALSARNLQRLCGPIIGHTWTSSGTEAANIATIISYINDVSAAGGDATLMLHRVVGPDAAANSIQISSNQLRALCVAIKAQVDAGALNVVLYSEYAR